MEQTSFVFLQGAQVGLSHAAVLRHILESAAHRANITLPANTSSPASFQTVAGEHERESEPAARRHVETGGEEISGGSGTEQQRDTRGGKLGTSHRVARGESGRNQEATRSELGRNQDVADSETRTSQEVSGGETGTSQEVTRGNTGSSQEATNGETGTSQEVTGGKIGTSQEVTGGQFTRGDDSHSPRRIRVYVLFGEP